MTNKSPTAEIAGPIGIDELDPLRFVDLVRQIVYGFRPWHQLEHTRVSVTEAGFAIRAVEAYLDPRKDHPVGSLDDAAELEPELRVWNVRCTTQGRIGPKTADEIAPELIEEGETPYGVVFAAPTSYSKETRGIFRGFLSEAGVREIHLWGPDELEDLLLRPENDQLLFTYAGTSLRVRRRRLATDLRRRQVIKGQLSQIFGRPHDPINTHGLLVRDPEELGYPFEDDVESFSEDDPPWIVAEFGGWKEPDYFPIVTKRFDAWFKKDEGIYDYYPGCNDAARNYNIYQTQPDQEEIELCDRLRSYMRTIPEEERAYFELRGWIHFDDILLIDDIGDSYFDPPHVLVARTAASGFFRRMNGFISQRYGSGKDVWQVDHLRRMALFPDPIPDVVPEPPTKLTF